MLSVFGDNLFSSLRAQMRQRNNFTVLKDANMDRYLWIHVAEISSVFRIHIKFQSYMYNVNSECELHTCLCLELWRDCALIQICFLILSTLTMVLLSNRLSRQFNLRVSWNTLPYLICYETAQIIDPVSCGTDSLQAWGHLKKLLFLTSA